MMKKILPCLFISSLFCAVPAMAQESAEDHCVLSIKSVPSATVILDENHVGTTPIKKEVSCNKHEIQLKLPSNDVTVHKYVTFEHGKTESITYDFSKNKWAADTPSDTDVRANKEKLSKSSSVQDNSSNVQENCSLVIKAKPYAVVTIDGKRVGTTPKKLNNLSCDAHEINLQQPSQKITVQEYVSLSRTSYAVAEYNFEKDEWRIDEEAVATEIEIKTAKSRITIPKEENDEEEVENIKGKRKKVISTRKRLQDSSVSQLPF